MIVEELWVKQTNNSVTTLYLKPLSSQGGILRLKCAYFQNQNQWASDLMYNALTYVGASHFAF